MGTRMTTIQRVYRLLEYLRWNTDSEHTTKQSEMRKADALTDCTWYKETFNKDIWNLATMLNCDEEHAKPEEEWRIVFDAFKETYKWVDEDNELEEKEDDDELPSRQIRNLYYQHTFSYEEIDAMIEAIVSAKTLDTETARKLIEKIKNNLTSKYYNAIGNVCTMQEPTLMDKTLLRKNLLLIQQAIDDKVQISFQFNGYDLRKKIYPVKARKDTVSPYYIVADGGRYYLLACKEIVRNGKPIRKMSIWRIDLMTEVEIPEGNEKGDVKAKNGIPILDKKEVENLPQKWTEDFQLTHINMSYDEPVWIKLRVKGAKNNQDYTFIHDWFGDNFCIMHGKDAGDPVVRVRCSPYGMVNWAMQYGSRVEVIDPPEVRAAVAERVREMQEMYQVGSDE